MSLATAVGHLGVGSGPPFPMCPHDPPPFGSISHSLRFRMQLTGAGTSGRWIQASLL